MIFSNILSSTSFFCIFFPLLLPLPRAPPFPFPWSLSLVRCYFPLYCFPNTLPQHWSLFTFLVSAATPRYLEIWSQELHMRKDIWHLSFWVWSTSQNKYILKILQILITRGWGCNSVQNMWPMFMETLDFQHCKFNKQIRSHIKITKNIFKLV